MGDDFVLRSRFHRGEAEQSRVIADAARDLGLGDGLPGRAGEACDQRQRPLGPARRRLGGELQHRPVQADVADRELRGVDADREPAGAGVDVIARQRALMDGIEAAIGVERQRMRGDHRALGDQAPHLGFDVAMMHGASSLSIFRAGDGERQFGRRRCGGGPNRMRWNGRSIFQPEPVRPFRNSSCS